MVTRVDKKPTIYNTTFLRCIKPAAIIGMKSAIDVIQSKSVGHSLPAASARDIVDDYEDIDHAFKLFGIDDGYSAMYSWAAADDDDESVRIARTFLNRSNDMKKVLRSESLMGEIVKIQSKILLDADKIYYGTEAVYQIFTRCLTGDVFAARDQPNYRDWCVKTAQSILNIQSPYLMIHPVATQAVTNGMGADCDYKTWYAWDMFKKIETLAVRISSRKNILAHAYYSGINRGSFTPDDSLSSDFLLPTTGYCQTKDTVKVHYVLGLRYCCIAGVMCILSHDDCINLATMAQCYFRACSYFVRSNGYDGRATDAVSALITDISAHCCRLIDAGKNYANVIRSMHILSQGEFNDAFEVEFGTNLGWSERSKNYRKEAHELDPMGSVFHARAIKLAANKMDQLNTCFIYHVFVGDEMLIEDLRSKVKGMSSKVRAADSAEWKNFINFVKAYTTCRFMLVYKRKPKVGGDVTLLNEKWAERCVAGMFTMPPRSEWGKVWIKGEFRYTDFADTWHLEAQDVAYVVKDSQGTVDGKFVTDKKIHSELIMAMCGGEILDTITGSTPKSARERICNGGSVTEVVLTTAPKAENAKPSWKKRVTFAADCEFRKMQAEFDRNCRRVMSFIRGPSLGVDQCILEKQFADISSATATGLNGAVCSHDISAWSESMDRERKFEFESVLINMFDKPEMINIKGDWDKINAVVTKQGCKDVYRIDNGSFQGFDGSASTILHSMILIYCIDTARRANIMDVSVKTNMATLIDDCIAFMMDLHKTDEATAFWDHLKATYLKLGFEIDDLKSIFSTIKAIYLSRRFVLGSEVPSDFKVFVKAHSSYEDPLRCTLDVPQDIFGAMRGACDANGEGMFIYFHACFSSLAEIAHNNGTVASIHPAAAAVFALAPVSENGWGFPSLISWGTNDVTDKRSHFNAIIELAAIHQCQPTSFTLGIDVYPKVVAKAVMCIKSQAWRIVSYSSIFTNPFDALREGPLKPDMLRRSAVQDILSDIAQADPWASLLKWNNSSTTNRVREMLIQSGYLHAPTLAALVNCMPDNYRLSLVGKAMGSESVLGLMQNSQRILLKRRIHRCSEAYFKYIVSAYSASNSEYTADDFSALNYVERTKMEREEFYGANGVQMTDHTFPDPVATFTVASAPTGSVISPNLSSLRIWDKTSNIANRTSQMTSDKGMYVPRRSGRVWEVTCEFAKGWDTVSQRIAMGLAVLARATADGHRVEGLLTYFVKAWNELSNITPDDTHLIAIHGSIKRLDANPGSSTHPVIFNRNILRGFNNKIKSALDVIPAESKDITGNSAHLHDFLAHETSMLAVTCVMLQTFMYLGKADHILAYNIATRKGCVIAECEHRMTTHLADNMINIEIMDGAENYGLLQACPSLIVEIAIPTMKSSWVKMINALIDRDISAIENMRAHASNTSTQDLLHELENDTVYYSPAVILASKPAARSTISLAERSSLTVVPVSANARTAGDSYTMAVKTVGSSLSRTLFENRPAHVKAAIVIRSIVWSRLKSESSHQLAKILYSDPDMAIEVVSKCKTTDFWRGIISEVAQLGCSDSLSNLCMSAFRSLGVIDLHLSHSNDTKAVTHSVASYFGAHLKSAVVIVSDLVTSLSGRKSSDYDKPLAERIVANNPSVLNAKLRRDHASKLIRSNIESYEERIDKIVLGEKHVTHRGDKRYMVSSKHARLVELRCRLYAYKATMVTDDGQAKMDEHKFGSMIAASARRVFEKHKANLSDLPSEPANYDDAITYMYKVQEALNRSIIDTAHGWDADSGRIGANLARETISIDANMVMNTKYAVSASEVAPKIHKKVVVTPASIPVAKHTDPPLAAPLKEVKKAGFLSLDEAEDEAFSGLFTRTVSRLSIPYWQALYSLLISGMYTPDEVNGKLGTAISRSTEHTALREAHLDDFTDDEITAAFPQIKFDYLGSGVVFNPEWLERDEADAYTTDEMYKSPSGFLF